MGSRRDPFRSKAHRSRHPIGPAPVVADHDENSRRPPYRAPGSGRSISAVVTSSGESRLDHREDRLEGAVIGEVRELQGLPIRVHVELRNHGVAILFVERDRDLVRALRAPRCGRSAQSVLSLHSSPSKPRRAEARVGVDRSRFRPPSPTSSKSKLTSVPMLAVAVRRAHVRANHALHHQ